MKDNVNMLHDGEKDLAERIKELNCLYNISRLFSQRSLSLETLLDEVIDIILPAWQYPERTCGRISLYNREVRSKNYRASNCIITETINTEDSRIGFVEVGYLGSDHRDPDVAFLDDEKRLLKAIAELLGNIVEKKEAELSLKQTTLELHKQKAELENKNIALREIISQIEIEKKALQDQLRLNIELTVLPLIKKLQNLKLSRDAWLNYLKILQQNLEDIHSTFAKKVTSDRVKLSPREMEICNLIKNGLANKEISELLQISILTVERHRHNIRKKFRIANEKINLATFLWEL